MQILLHIDRIFRLLPIFLSAPISTVSGFLPISGRCCCAVDRKIGLTARIIGASRVSGLLQQRIYQIGSGYEDGNETTPYSWWRNPQLA